MNKKKYIQLFIRFLKERGIYKLFLKEFYSNNAFKTRAKCCLPLYVRDFLDDVWDERYISYAFTWDLTTHGEWYWNSISRLWVIELEKYEKQESF